jgi:hypothetical protein
MAQDGRFLDPRCGGVLHRRERGLGRFAIRHAPGTSGTSATKLPPSSSGRGSMITGPAMGFCSGLHSLENASRRRKTLGIQMGADICVQTESLART